MKVIKNFLGLFLGLLILSACKKNDAEIQTRLFRPPAASQISTVNNSILASWPSIKSAVNYQVRVSRDTFRTIDVAFTIDTNAIQIDNLRWDQLYQLQVRAIAADTAFNSGWSFIGSIKVPKFPTILNTPTLADVTEEAIKVSWTNSGATVTSIKVLKTDSSLVRDVPLSLADVANQFKIISGLTANTPYIIMLYSGTQLRGYDTYTTKAPLAGTIVDLRSITDRPSVLMDTLPFVDAGATILLKRGLTYNISSNTALSKAVTIRSGADLSVKSNALIYFTSNFNFAAGSNIDFIDFKELDMKSDNYSSRYVFNTTASANVGRISFENCHIEIFRGITRLQSNAGIVTNFVVDNCILDSLAGYGVITVDNVACKAENISIKNTTIYKAEKIVTSRQNSTSVVIDKVTLNEGPLAGNYLVDYSTSGTNNVTNGVQVSNCLFGIAKNFGVGVRGIRTGTSTSVVASNNYATSDYTVAATTPFPIPDLNIHTKKSTEVWQDPSTGNFKLIDASLLSKNVGDPRWR